MRPIPSPKWAQMVLSITKSQIPYVRLGGWGGEGGGDRLTLQLLMASPNMGHSQKGGDNFEKCSVKTITKLILSTYYFFHTSLSMFSIIYN